MKTRVKNMKQWAQYGLLVSVSMVMAACSEYPPNAFQSTTEVVTKTIAVPQVLPAVEASYGYGNDPAIIKAYQMYRKTGIAPKVYTDGFISFPYSIDTQPIVQCAPMYICTVQFQEGELIKNVSLGDTANWEVQPMFIGGNWPSGAEVLVIKPKAADMSTNLVVTTDKRLYNIGLLSSQTNKYARLVTFYYPTDTDVAISAAATQALQEQQTHEQSVVSSSPNVDLNHVNFNYSIKGDSPTWKPTRVFDDGTHTFVEFPSILGSTDLPVLYIEDNGDKELVNWRKSGNYFVVDRLFGEAVLISGVGNDQTKVTIVNNAMSS